MRHTVADALKVEGISHTLREQCLSQIHFPNGAADIRDYGPDGLNLPEPAFYWIKSGLIGGGKGRFLLKQGTRYTPLQFSIEGDHLEDVRAELSARTETVNLMDRIIAEIGTEDRDELFRVFHERRKHPSFQRLLRRSELVLAEAAD